MSFNLESLHEFASNTVFYLTYEKPNSTSTAYEIKCVEKTNGGTYNIYFHGRPPLLNYTQRMASESSYVVRSYQPKLCDLASRKLLSSSLSVGVVLALPEGFARITSMTQVTAYKGYECQCIYVDTSKGERSILVAWDTNQVIIPLTKLHTIYGIYNTTNLDDVPDHLRMEKPLWRGIAPVADYASEIETLQNYGAPHNIKTVLSIQSNAHTIVNLMNQMESLRDSNATTLTLSNWATRTYVTTGVYSLTSAGQASTKPKSNIQPYIPEPTVLLKEVSENLLKNEDVVKFHKKYMEVASCTP